MSRVLKPYKLVKIANRLGNPRFMTYLSSNSDTNGCGSLLIADRSTSERGSGRIWLVDGSGESSPQVWASNLESPTSISINRNKLYVGETTRVSCFDLASHQRYTAIADLPGDGGHTSKTVLAYNDKLYVSIGSSCNSCIENDKRRASVMEYDLKDICCMRDSCSPGQVEGRVYSSGLRNSVGLAVNPWTQDIWVTTNARDHLGDDIPPDTVDILRPDTFFGWPYCHAGKILDPELARTKGECEGLPQPVILLPAHSAPLGLAFYDPNNPMMPPGFRRGLYIALHGSWNRSSPVGYSVVFVSLDENGNVNSPVQTLIQWPKESDGVRPVGLTFGPCGLYISDDSRGNLFMLYHL